MRLSLGQTHRAVLEMALPSVFEKELCTMKKLFTLMAVCLLFARPIISLFVDDPAVVELGAR